MVRESARRNKRVHLVYIQEEEEKSERCRPSLHLVRGPSAHHTEIRLGPPQSQLHYQSDLRKETAHRPIH